MSESLNPKWQWVWVNSYYPGLVYELKERARGFVEFSDGPHWSPQPLLDSIERHVNEWKCALLLDRVAMVFRGHSISWIFFDGANRELYTLQCEIQGSCPGAFLDLITKLEAWGREKGASRHRIVTNRDPASYLKHLDRLGIPGMVSGYIGTRDLREPGGELYRQVSDQQDSKLPD